MSADMTGQRVHRLVVLRPAEPGTRGRAQWVVRCDCGTERVVAANNLRNGNTRSCGCLRGDFNRTRRQGLRHGHAVDGRRHHLYSTWAAMIGRCNNPTATGYEFYGGKGVMVCDRWRDFAAFLADVGERPPGTSLDRIDSSGNYEPGNVRWADADTQARNRSITRLTIDTAQEALGRLEHGESGASIARRLGVSVGCISNLRQGHTWRDLAPLAA